MGCRSKPNIYASGVERLAGFADCGVFWRTAIWRDRGGAFRSRSRKIPTRHAMEAHAIYGAARCTLAVYGKRYRLGQQLEYAAGGDAPNHRRPAHVDN